MLLILFSFILFFLICYGYGSFIYPLVSENTGSISLSLFSGVLFLILVHSIVAFFYPLNFYYEWFINGIGIILGGINLYKNGNILKYIITYQFLILSTPVVFTASFYPYIVDHFGYYVPTIKWLNEFGIVKGIANLSFILGQQSPWHILQAGLDNSLDPFLKLNAYFLLFYIIYYLENKKIELLLPFPLFLLYVQSPSPDLAIIVFTLIIIFESSKASNSLSYLLLLSVATCFIKPLVFGLVIWIFYLIFKEKQFHFFYKKQWKFSILFSFILGILFLSKNFYTSGLPLFPLSCKIGNPMWMVSKDFIENSNKIALLKTYDMHYSLLEISRMSTFSKFLHWIMLPGFKGVIHKAFIIILLLYFIIIFYYKQKRFLVFGIISLINLIIIYLFSAQYRFMLPVILGFLFVVIYLLNLNKKIVKSSIYTISAVMILLLTFPNIFQLFVPSFQLSNLMRQFEINLLIKPESYSAPTYKTKKIGNLLYNVPINYPYTYSIPIPAISIYEDENFKNSLTYPQLFLSNDISKGFYTKIRK